MEDGAKGPGWSWNKKTNTLTLNNFAGISDAHSNFFLYFNDIDGDVNIVLSKGSSNIVSGIDLKSHQRLKISGNGKLETDDLYSPSYNCDIEISGGASVTMNREFNQNSGSLTLDRGKLYCKYYIFAGEIILKASSELRTDQRIEVWDSMTIGSGCKASVIWPENFWNYPLTVQNKLEVSGELIVDGNDSYEPVRFICSGPEDKIDNHLYLNGTAVTDPEDIEWTIADSYFYPKNKDHFVVLPKGYSLKSLSKVTIDEDAAGRKLKVSSISPADATVDYF